MPTPAVTITIDRTGLALAALVASGVEGSSTTLAVSAYREPAMQARIHYAPSLPYVHGEQKLGWSWQQSILVFEVFPDVADETAARAAIAELVTAVSQFSFTVTVEVGDAPAETWRCDPGSVEPLDGRSFVDLRDSNPTWLASIPCHPIREVA